MAGAPFKSALILITNTSPIFTHWTFCSRLRMADKGILSTASFSILSILTFSFHHKESLTKHLFYAQDDQNQRQKHRIVIYLGWISRWDNPTWLIGQVSRRKISYMHTKHSGESISVKETWWFRSKSSVHK